MQPSYFFFTHQLDYWKVRASPTQQASPLENRRNLSDITPWGVNAISYKLTIIHLLPYIVNPLTAYNIFYIY